MLYFFLLHFFSSKKQKKLFTFKLKKFILYNTLKNLKVVLNVFLEITPKNIDIEKVKKHILKIKGINDVHHIHVRSIDGYNNFATMHVVVNKYDGKIKREVKEELRGHGYVILPLNLN